MIQSASEKRRFLAAALKKGTGGVLSNKVIGRILRSVSVNRQYNVTTFSSSSVFQAAVDRARAGNALQSAVYSRHGDRLVAAVVLPVITPGLKRSRRAIYIYIPNHRMRKGAKS